MRSMRGALLIAIGVLDAMPSSASGPPCCCPDGCDDGAAACEWVTPAGCCEIAPLATGPGVTSMPASPLVPSPAPRASAQSHRTPGHAPSTLQRVISIGVVLRL